MSTWTKVVRWIVAASWLLGGPVAQAFSPEPLTQPNLTTDGVVGLIAHQPDGGIIMVGTFSSVNGVARPNLARVLPDGSLDMNWNPSSNGFSIDGIAIGSDGSVFVAGDFTQIGGQSRNGLAKLSAGGAGNADANWNPPSLGSGVFVNALAVAQDGFLYVADTHAMVRIATSGNGALDTVWSPAIGGNVRAIQPFSDGNIYVGGQFLPNSQAGCVARISATGTGAIDTSWRGDALFVGGDCQIRTIATDGAALFVGGVFVTPSTNHIGLAKIRPQGTGQLDSWDADLPSGSGNSVSSIVYDGHGSIYVGGSFSSICRAFGTCVARYGLAKIATASAATLDSNWNPAGNVPATSVFSSIDVTTDHYGLIVAGHSGSSGNMALGTQSRSGVAVLPIDNDGVFFDGFE